MLSAEPVCSCACSCAHLARETAGAARTRLSLRPLFLEGGTQNKTRAYRAAGSRTLVVHHRHAPPTGRPNGRPMTGSGGASSTPRPLGLSADVSGILDRPVKPDDDNGEAV